MAKLVNITGPSSYDDKPLDLYWYIAVKVKSRLEEMIQGNNINNKNYLWGKSIKDKERIVKSCKNLLNLQINRKLVKTAIMVKPYNASIESRTQYLKDKLVKVLRDKEIFYTNEEGLYFSSYDLTVYSTVIDKVLAKEYPKIGELNRYLGKIANICYKLDIPVIWTVPAGLEVKQKYLKSEAIELKPFKYSRTGFKLNKPNKEIINLFKQKRSLMPNLVHSLDASSLSLLVDNLLKGSLTEKEGNLNFYAIHDCFATNYNKFEDLVSCLKAVYIRTYTNDSYLKTFDQGIKNYIISIYGKDVFDKNSNNLILEVNNEVITIEYPDVNKVILGKIEAAAISSSHAGLY